MSKPKVLNTNGIEALLKVEISKNARGCVAQHISKPKWLKHLSVGALLEVEMSKKCASLWREARSQVKSVVER